MKYMLLFILLPLQLLAQRVSEKPNIILIVADDLGYGDVACYGQQKIETPQITALAKQGMQFNQFYAGTAVCAPSRASLLTGLHTGHTAVRGNKGMKPEGQYPLPDSAITIAETLQQNGYVTAAFGKWGLGFPGSTGTPLKQGIQTFYGYNCQTLAHDYYPDHLWQNDTRIELPGNTKGDSVYSADLIHQQALAFLAAQQKGRPFFLFLPYTLPHAALYGPHDSLYQYYVSKFKEQDRPRPVTVKQAEYHFEPQPHAAFAAMVARLDSYVGEIRKQVEKQGMADNTIIIFTSDNGPHKEGGADPAFFGSSGPYRGIKRDLYEGGIRVPFIVSWPGNIRYSSATNEVGTFWDVYTTLADLAGVKKGAKTDGLSLLPVFKGKAMPQKHAYLYWEFHESGGRQAVRYGPWKGVRLNVSNEADPPVELYNLDQDPAEEHDVAAQHPGIIQHIKTLLKEAHVPDANWPLLAIEKSVPGKQQ
jgi:arylsulfatase A-like enzyme